MQAPIKGSCCSTIEAPCGLHQSPVGTPRQQNPPQSPTTPPPHPHHSPVRTLHDSPITAVTPSGHLLGPFRASSESRQSPLSAPACFRHRRRHGRRGLSGPGHSDDHVGNDNLAHLVKRGATAAGSTTHAPREAPPHERRLCCEEPAAAALHTSPTSWCQVLATHAKGMAGRLQQLRCHLARWSGASRDVRGARTRVPQSRT